MPAQELGFNLNKQEFLDADKQSKYSLHVCMCGGFFATPRHDLQTRKIFIKRQNDPRDLAAELLSTVYGDVEVDPVPPDISGEQLKRGADKAKGARLNLRARGFCEQQRSAFPDVRVCDPNAESYKNIVPQQIYRMHKNEKNSQYSRRVLGIERYLYHNQLEDLPKDIFNNNMELEELTQTFVVFSKGSVPIQSLKFYSVSSPAYVNYALTRTAEDNGVEYGIWTADTFKTVSAVLMYDVLKSASIEDEAIKLEKDDKPVFENGGFNFHHSVQNTETSVTQVLENTVSFVMRKARMKPKKTISILRLELAVATLSIKIGDILKDYSLIESKVARRFISNESSRFHVHEAIRVQLIHDPTIPAQGPYVDSTSNIVDEGLRGTSSKELVEKISVD
ncbi:hypothetical protein AWC38_SpisGene8209 [Stylophora pistillata]|uniref:Uncharacterized protein n=1 Tax=Stylophora pistillata TaxID=50429 RepID=A0A2B4SB11_STYPI|nr:hypothetical protein AWC38_SpisGene8209 [Stylophora pistillata]